MNKIAFTEAYYDSFTGAQKSMLPLIERGESTEGVFVSPKWGKCTEEMEARGIETEVINYPERLDVFDGKLLTENKIQTAITGGTLLRYYIKVVRKLRQGNYDVVYCNNLRSLLLFGPPAKLLRIPVVWYVRIDNIREEVNPMNRIGLRVADHVVTISDGVRSRFDKSDLRNYGHKIKTIYTGVDLTEFDPSVAPLETDGQIDEEAFIIVQVASLHPRKGQEHLIRAVAEIKEELNQFQLVFAGTASEEHDAYETHLRELVEECGLMEQTVFLGWCDDVPGLLSLADVFVLPSESEGFPRSILEAFAMEVPVIATPAGGTDELVNDQKSGLLVDKIEVEEFAKLITKLYEYPSKRNELSQFAKEKVHSELSIDQYVSNFEHFIKSKVATD